MRTLKPMARAQLADGFTLVEMAVCILIIGLLISAGCSAYYLYLVRQAAQTTKTNVETIASAIGDYRTLYGRYPCPASLTAQRTDPAYGHESATDCTTALPAGVFRETSTRTPYQYPTQPAPEEPLVRIGAIPFRELNMQEDQSLDGYDHRIFYAVTERLATSADFKPDAAASISSTRKITRSLSSRGPRISLFSVRARTGPAPSRATACRSRPAPRRRPRARTARLPAMRASRRFRRATAATTRNSTMSSPISRRRTCRSGNIPPT